MADVIKEFWSLIIGIMASVVWLVRLEGKTLENKSEIRRLWLQRREDKSAEKVSSDKVDKRLDDIAADIKILEREGKR